MRCCTTNISLSNLLASEIFPDVDCMAGRAWTWGKHPETHRWLKVSSFQERAPVSHGHFYNASLELSVKYFPSDRSYMPFFHHHHSPQFLSCLFSVYFTSCSTTFQLFYDFKRHNAPYIMPAYTKTMLDSLYFLSFWNVALVGHQYHKTFPITISGPLSNIPFSPCFHYRFHYDIHCSLQKNYLSYLCRVGNAILVLFSRTEPQDYGSLAILHS